MEKDGSDKKEKIFRLMRLKYAESWDKVQKPHYKNREGEKSDVMLLVQENYRYDSNCTNFVFKDQL